jgi:hypothetical protein
VIDGGSEDPQAARRIRHEARQAHRVAQRVGLEATPLAWVRRVALRT